MNNYFILYTNCIAVKGAQRSVICDLQQGRIKLIPNLLFDILEQAKTLPVSSLKIHYENKLDEGIDKYLALLQQEDYGFITHEPGSFPELNMHWDNPNEITNAILEVYPLLPYDIVIDQLHHLGCSALQLRSFEAISADELNDILTLLKSTRIDSVEILINQDHWKEDDILSLCKKHLRVRSVILHSADRNEFIYVEKSDVRLTYTKARIESHVHCGVINPDYFTSNVRFFTESKSFNTCLNRKISIDRLGEIRNCPSMAESYGNIATTRLKSVLDNTAFTRYWSISKSKVSICKDCEFRHVCTDCRAYVEDPGDILSKPLKCGYDPYTTQWESWSTNPLKKEAMDHYGLIQKA